MQLSAKVTLMTSGKTKKECLRVKCENKSVENRNEYSQEAWREILFQVWLVLEVVSGLFVGTFNSI